MIEKVKLPRSIKRAASAPGFAIVALTAVAFAISGATALAAEPGALDAAFGGDGHVSLPGKSDATLAAGDDGRLFVSVRTKESQWVMALQNSGELDSTFGANGALALPAPPSSGCMASFHFMYSNCRRRLAVLGDGRLMLLSSGLESAEVRRITAFGRLDETYGTLGVAQVPLNVHSMLVADDGSVILIARRIGPQPGDYYGSEIVLARLTSDGVLDPGFGGDGTVETGASGEPFAGEWGSLGRVVIVGRDHGQAIAWRFNADGTPDGTFGAAGRVKLSNKPLYFNSSGDHWNAATIASVPDGGFSYGGEDTFYGCTIKGAYDCTASFEGWVSADGKPTGFDSLQHERFNGPSAAFSNEDAVFLAGEYGEFSGMLRVRRYNFDRSIHSDYGIDGSTLSVPTSGFFEVDDAIVQTGGRQTVALSGTVDVELIRLLGDAPGVAAPNREINYFRRSLIRSKHKLSVAGLASPSDAIVEVAVNRFTRKSARRGSVCTWYSPRRRAFRRARRSAGSCERPHYFRVGSGARWRFAIKRRLRPGEYELHVRAITADGKMRTPFTRGIEGYRNFTIRRR